jgi:hypothetical protein
MLNETASVLPNSGEKPRMAGADVWFQDVGCKKPSLFLKLQSSSNSTFCFCFCFLYVHIKEDLEQN